MDDVIALALSPFLFVFKWLYKAVFYFAVEVLHNCILSAAGWAVFRIVSFGNDPAVDVSRGERVSLAKAVVVPLVGALLTVLFMG